MTAVSRKTRYHHGDLREALLTAAEELLAESGVPGLTLRACARRAGVSHAAPKHHFADIAELLSEVAARGFGRLSAELRQSREAAGEGPEARFVAVAQTYVQFATRYPAHFRLMFRSDVLRADHPPLRAAARQTYAEMTNAITAQRGDPEVTAEDLDARIADGALVDDILIGWSHVHGYAQLLLEGQLDPFGAARDGEAFVRATLARSGARLARLLREDAAGGRG